MAKTLLLIRHGETTWNAIRRMQGQANSPLSEQGIEQARELKPHLAKRSYKSVTSSDLNRTVDTGAAAGFPDATRQEIWREIHVGDWSGQLYTDLAKTYPAEIEAWKQAAFTPPNAENWDAFVRRVSQAISTFSEADNGTHLVFTHGLVVKAAYCIFTGTHHTKVPPISNCSWSEFDLGAYTEKGADEACEISFNQTLYHKPGMAYL